MLKAGHVKRYVWMVAKKGEMDKRILMKLTRGQMKLIKKLNLLPSDLKKILKKS